MPQAIVTENLTKYYGKLLALDNLNMKIKRGESVGLLGPNGAGKSTTIKLLCGLIRPSGGRAYVNDFNVIEEHEAAVENLGVIVETPEFYPFLTPEEILKYFGHLRGVKNLKEKIKEVLRMVGLEKWAKVKIENFSSGMKQRLAIAQAFLHDPPILILDEPSSGLDPKGMVEIRNILKSIKGEKTILLSSHLLNEVVQVCDKIAIMNEGRLQAFNSVRNLKRKYGSLERAYIRLTGG
ncbi:MAG: ABC transporter ATP-binding protein [Candidatus Hadarchaeales archaeon]